MDCLIPKQSIYAFFVGLCPFAFKDTSIVNVQGDSIYKYQTEIKNEFVEFNKFEL